MVETNLASLEPSRIRKNHRTRAEYLVFHSWDALVMDLLLTQLSMVTLMMKLALANNSIFNVFS